MIEVSHLRLRFLAAKLYRPGVALMMCAAAWNPAAKAQQPESSIPAGDGRLERLTKYFQARRCPLDRYAAEFLDAADRYHLDWRLLPSLAMIETGGRLYTRNNIFGWASGRAKFETVPEGIYHVARHLAESRPYAGKDLRAKLRAYNPVNRWYPDLILRMFRDISPEPAAAPAGGR